MLPRRRLVRFQDRIHKGHQWFQLRSFSLRCFASYRHCASHHLTHNPPVNPQLLGDSSDRSTILLVLPSDLLVAVAFAALMVEITACRLLLVNLPGPMVKGLVLTSEVFDGIVEMVKRQKARVAIDRLKDHERGAQPRVVD
jgi:hypothetical protein